MEDWMRKLDTYENGQYFSIEEVEQFFRDKKVVTQDEFMKELEKVLGYCSSNNRMHTFLDFELKNNGDYICMDCNMDIDSGRWESGRTLENFVIGQSWVQARTRKNLEPE